MSEPTKKRFRNGCPVRNTEAELGVIALVAYFAYLDEEERTEKRRAAEAIEWQRNVADILRLYPNSWLLWSVLGDGDYEDLTDL